MVAGREREASGPLVLEREQRIEPREMMGKGKLTLELREMKVISVFYVNFPLLSLFLLVFPLPKLCKISTDSLSLFFFFCFLLVLSPFFPLLST